MSTNPVLREGYRRCAKLTWQYGTTYYWGALLLPRPQRRHVYAVYALCRLADDIVDLPDPAGRATPAVGARLEAFADQFRTALIDRGSDDPVMAAIVHSVITCGIEPECFDRFFGAMAMDLTTSTYETWADLCGYMEGSAAVIGEMMLPVLEPTSPKAKAPARSLGLAFQLTNFLRDIDEDLDRGRVYMPQEDLRHFGVDLGDAHGDAGVAGVPGVRDRAQPGAVLLRRHRDRPAAAPVGPLRGHGPGAVRADPGQDRAAELRRILLSRPGAHLA